MNAMYWCVYLWSVYACTPLKSPPVDSVIVSVIPTPSVDQKLRTPSLVTAYGAVVVAHAHANTRRIIPINSHQTKNFSGTLDSSSRSLGPVVMESEGGGEDLASLLESTFTLSRGLETLYSEHEVLLEALGEEDRESETGRRDGGARHGWLLANSCYTQSSFFIISSCAYIRTLVIQTRPFLIYNFFPGNQDFDLEEFGVQMKVEKTAALSHSMDQLKAGIEEAKVCINSHPPPPPPPLSLSLSLSLGMYLLMPLLYCVVTCRAFKGRTTKHGKSGWLTQRAM